MNPDPISQALHQLGTYIGHVEAGKPVDTNLVESALFVLQGSAISSEDWSLLRDFQGRIKNLPPSPLTKRISAFLLGETDQSDYIPPLVQELINGLSMSPIVILRGLSTLFQLAINPTALQAIFSIPQGQRTLDVIQAIATLFSGPHSRALLQTVQGVDPDQRVDVIKQTLSFLQTISDKGQGTDILEDIKDVSQKADVIKQTLSFLQTISDEEQRAFTLEVIKDIHPDQRTDVIKKALPLLQGISDGHERAFILKAIKGILPDQRADVIKKALPLLQGISDGHERAFILEAVKDVSSDQRTDVIEKVLPLVQDISDGYEIAGILRAVKDVSPDQRTDVIEKAIPLVQDISDGYEIANILGAINVSPDQRTDVIKQMISLLQDISDGRQRANILEAIKGIDPNQRADVIKQTISLLQDISDGYEIAGILRAVKDVSPDQRTDVIKQTISLIQDISDERQRAYILTAIENILPNQRADVLKKAIPLLQGISNGDQIATILQAVKGISLDQITDAIKQMCLLFQDIKEDSTQILMLNAIEGIPPDQRVDVVKEVLPLLQSISDGYEIAGILRAIQDIDPGQRVDVVKEALPLLQSLSDAYQIADILRAIEGISLDQIAGAVKQMLLLFQDIQRYPRASLLKAVKNIPPDQRADVIKQAIPLLQGIANGSQRENILRTIKNIPPDQRADVIKQAIPLLQDISDGDQRENILRTIKNIPPDQRADVIKQAIPLLQDISDGDQRENILQLLPLISPDKRSEAGSILLQSSLQERTLYRLFLKNEGIKEASHGYLLARLDFLAPEKEAVRVLVDSILNDPATFAVSRVDDDPLIRKATAFRTILNSNQNDPKNPYKLYQDLQAQEPLLDLCPSSYEGFSLDLQGLRNNVDRYEFTLQKMPPNTFQDLFTALQGRLEDPTVSKEIEEAFPKQDPHQPKRALNAKEIVASLEENILRGPFIPRHLQIQKLNEKVPSMTFYLYSILEALCKMNKAPSLGALSEQEMALLSFADAVQSCSTGQQDGISNYYRYTDKSSLQEEEGEEPLFLQISHCIQHVLQETFASHSLLKALTKKSTLSQASHQTLYLQNRLYKQVGLKHHLTFDLHTHTLYDSLLQASPSDLLKVFFEECTLEKMADQVEKDLQELLKTKPGLMGLLSTILRQEGFSKEMVWNEDTKKLELTSKGICVLLKYFNYLKKEEV